MRPDITATEQSLYFDEPPAIAIIREEVRKARTFHKCHCCGNPIEPGTKYRYFFVKDHEAIPPRAFSSHQHFYCEP